MNGFRFALALAALLAAPAASFAQANASTEDVLDRLQRAGEKIKDIRSDVRLESVNTILEQKVVRTGRLFYKEQEPNAMFLVRFDQVDQDGVISDHREWHLFDGLWYTEARELTKQIIRREILRPGEKINPFELGKGPFPLPFGQRKDEMLARFEIELRAAAPGDPPGTKHLYCVPRPDTELAEKYRTIELYISDRLDVPVRIIADQLDDNRVTVDFEKLELNPGVAGSEFKVPTTQGWDTVVEPLPEGAAVAPPPA